jgi:very-short-patch-repair endonuclease
MTTATDEETDLIERAEHISYSMIRRLYGKRTGATSPYEHYLADLLSKLDAPHFLQQFQIGDHRVDFFVPSARTIIEVDGFFHEMPQIERRDRQLDALADELGFHIIRITTDELEERGITFAKRLTQSLIARAADFADIEAVFKWRHDGRTRTDWPPDLGDRR